jgi:hypothetical protein
MREGVCASVLIYFQFADTMHESGVKVTVDVATWNEVWDWQLIDNTSVDKVMYV